MYSLQDVKPTLPNIMSMPIDFLECGLHIKLAQGDDEMKNLGYWPVGVFSSAG